MKKRISKPWPPYKPIPPKETVEKTSKLKEFYYEPITFSTLGEFGQDFIDGNCQLEMHSGYEDDSGYIALHKKETISNKSYDRELKEYNKKLEQYKTDEDKYNADMKAWEEQEKADQIANVEAEIKKFKSAARNITKLEKKLAELKNK